MELTSQRAPQSYRRPLATTDLVMHCVHASIAKKLYKVNSNGTLQTKVEKARPDCTPLYKEWYAPIARGKHTPRLCNSYTRHQTLHCETGLEEHSPVLELNAQPCPISSTCRHIRNCSFRARNLTISQFTSVAHRALSLGFIYTFSRKPSLAPTLPNLL